MVGATYIDVDFYVLKAPLSAAFLMNALAREQSSSSKASDWTTAVM